MYTNEWEKYKMENSKIGDYDISTNKGNPWSRKNISRYCNIFHGLGQLNLHEPGTFK